MFLFCHFLTGQYLNARDNKRSVVDFFYLSMCSHVLTSIELIRQLGNSECYLQPCQRSVMKFYEKKLTTVRLCKKRHHRCLAGLQKCQYLFFS